LPETGENGRNSQTTSVPDGMMDIIIVVVVVVVVIIFVIVILQHIRLQISSYSDSFITDIKVKQGFHATVMLFSHLKKHLTESYIQ
jgi:hypothetical protein